MLHVIVSDAGDNQVQFDINVNYGVINNYTITDDDYRAISTALLNTSFIQTNVPWAELPISVSSLTIDDQRVITTE